MNAQTLFEALQAIPDQRTKKGRRFELATILIIALAAMLSGANDLLAIARWGRRLSPKALWALGASKKRRKAPCHATYHYVFQDISPADLRAALGVCWSISKVASGMSRSTASGSAAVNTRTSPGIHMLHAFSSKLRAVGRLSRGAAGQWRMHRSIWS